MASNSSIRSLNREAEHRSIIRLHDVRLMWNLHVLHELSNRIFIVSTNTTNVIGVVPGMDTRGRVNKLRDSTRRLDTGNSSRDWDTQLISPDLIRLDSSLLKCSQCRGEITKRVDTIQDIMVHNTSQRYTKESLFLCVLSPNLPEVGEVSISSLDSTKYSSKLNLTLKLDKAIICTDYNLSQVTELIGTEDNL